MIRVTIYNEYVHEQLEDAVRAIYPEGIHKAIGKGIASDEISVRYATLETIEETLTEEILDDTDVLIWWGHMRHNEVPDEIAIRVQKSVLKGMGLVVLHSGHNSKPFKLLMGTECNVTWRESDDLVRLWAVNPAHPICEGVNRFIEIPHEETYTEPFGIPQPDELVFISWYSGGEVFRSGAYYRRGNGKIFYFQPGHESYPIYYNEDVLRVIRNAIDYVFPTRRYEKLIGCPKAPPLVNG